MLRRCRLISIVDLNPDSWIWGISANGLLTRQSGLHSSADKSEIDPLKPSVNRRELRPELPHVHIKQRAWDPRKRPPMQLAPLLKHPKNFIRLEKSQIDSLPYLACRGKFGDFQIIKTLSKEKTRTVTALSGILGSSIVSFISFFTKQ